MHPDYPRFSVAQVANAVDRPVETLRTWLKKGAIALWDGNETDSIPDVIAPGTGRGRLLSLRLTLNIALTSELNRIGIPVNIASDLAICFSHIGEVVSGWGNNIPSPARGAGQLYANGLTMFVVRFPTDNGDPEAEVVEFNKMDKWDLLHVGAKEYRSAVIVNVNDIVRRVSGALGVSTI